MNQTLEVARIFVIGVVATGIITALFLPGRTTVEGFKQVGTQARGLLGTAISGKA